MDVDLLFIKISSSLTHIRQVLLQPVISRLQEGQQETFKQMIIQI